MPHHSHLSGHKKGAMLACYRCSISLENIAGDINCHPTTMSWFLDRYKRSVRKNPRQNAKKKLDADVRGIMRHARSENCSTMQIEKDMNLSIFV